MIYSCDAKLNLLLYLIKTTKKIAFEECSCNNNL